MGNCKLWQVTLRTTLFRPTADVEELVKALSVVDGGTKSSYSVEVVEVKDLEKEEFKLTKKDREALVEWYADYQFNGYEWHKDRCIWEICKVGLTGAEELSDESLFDVYVDYTLSDLDIDESTVLEDTVVPIKVVKTDEGLVAQYIGDEKEASDGK